MNFFEYQDKARLNTKLLILLLVIAVIFIILAINAAIALYLIFGVEEFNKAQLPQILLYSSIIVILFVLFFSLFKKIKLAKGGTYVAQNLGAVELDYTTKDFKEKQLINVVEEMAIASGTPVPKIFILEEENINAFAAGHNIDDAVVAVTRGALEKFNRDELQAVIAHEFSHIFNGDMRININLMALLFGIIAISHFGRSIIESRYYSRDRNSDASKIIIVGLVLMIIGYIGVFFGKIIKALISRQREYLADASSVQFTRNPKAIANALKKIGADFEHQEIKSAKAEEYSHAFFSQISPSQFFSKLFATHPPLDQRIKRVEPNWNGEFEAEILQNSNNEFSDTQNNNSNNKQQMASIASTIMASAMINKIENIGNINQDSIDNAHNLIQNIPTKIIDYIHDLKTTQLVIFASLIAKKKESLIEKQLQYLKTNYESNLATKNIEVIQDCYDFFYNNNRKIRLAVIELAFLGLKQMSEEQYLKFKEICNWLIKSDGKISLSEWCIKKIIFKTLDRNFNYQDQIADSKYHINDVANEVSVILSLLANIGKRNEDDSNDKFNLAIKEFKLSRKIKLLTKTETNFKAVSQSFKKLTMLKAKDKEIFLKLCVRCASSDDVITNAESELLQAIAAILDCPISVI